MIRKTITKRDHKLLDYDRYRISLKKLQDKKDRKLSDEKEIFKVRVWRSCRRDKGRPPVPVSFESCLHHSNFALISLLYIVGVSAGSGDR